MKTSSRIAVIGLGKTGLSCLQYLSLQSHTLFAIDLDNEPRSLTVIQDTMPAVSIHLGEYPESLLLTMDCLVVSPGVDRRDPVLARVIAAGVSVMSDVDLFCQAHDVPIIAVTGSNGKTTVTQLITDILTAAGVSVRAGGNIGVPVLSLLAEPRPQYYVLELSSFQLELLDSLRQHTAVLLNVTPDHLDRYSDFAAYQQAKLRILQGARAVVGPLSQPQLLDEVSCDEVIRFGSEGADCALVTLEHERVICYRGNRLGSIDSFVLQGVHHWLNACAAIAAVATIGVDLACAYRVCRDFAGVEHRCQKVSDYRQVSWFNDSKATNEAAAIAAITTLSSLSYRRLVLIAGGQAKGATFEALARVVSERVSALIVMGEAASDIARQVTDRVPCHHADTLPDAVQLADSLVESGDAVLLAPACASFDMFDHYQHRGDVFCQAIVQLES